MDAETKASRGLSSLTEARRWLLLFPRQFLPAGVLGPQEATLDIRAYLMPHPTGLTLVDTGMAPSGRSLDQALAEAGATWADASEVVITHANPDHIGALVVLC